LAELVLEGAVVVPVVLAALALALTAFWRVLLATGLSVCMIVGMV
jgi:hypothetical protein